MPEPTRSASEAKPDERPTLAQLAAHSNANPWACPRCGCRDWRVANTYDCKTDSSIHRRRICRNCNEVRISIETMPEVAQ